MTLDTILLMLAHIKFRLFVLFVHEPLFMNFGCDHNQTLWYWSQGPSLKVWTPQQHNGIVSSLAPALIIKKCRNFLVNIDFGTHLLIKFEFRFSLFDAQY